MSRSSGVKTTSPGSTSSCLTRAAGCDSSCRPSPGKSRAIRPQELEQEIYINPATMAPVLKAVIDDYVQTVCIKLNTAYDAENLSAAMSLVASTGGVTLFPRYVQNMLTRAVVCTRPLERKSLR